jgi:hypothetical protein
MGCAVAERTDAELVEHVRNLERLREVILTMEREAMKTPVLGRLFLHLVMMTTSVMDPEATFELVCDDGLVLMPRAVDVRSVASAIFSTRMAGAFFREQREDAKPGAVILGHSPEECDRVYPRTRDGRCQGCGIVGDHPARQR